MQHAIEVNNLRKSYKKVTVLKDVTFAVKKGSIFALLGSNGAGKTTTINILTTLLSADNGSAKVTGYDTASQPQLVREHISLTGQFAAVDAVLTGRENLELVAELRHVAQPKQVAEQLLKQFELTEAANRPAQTYSGGMRRRLDIAMSLIGSPEVIFLDEPTTGLDPQSRNLMWQKIKALADNDTTVFLTTQYLEEADQLADQIAILNEGKIVAQGTSAELKKTMPHSTILLSFQNTDELQKAMAALTSFAPVGDADKLIITILNKDGSQNVARIFKELDAKNIEITEFAQKSVTLDDVFLSTVTNKEQK